MNYLKSILYRWDREELQKWPSLKKTAYLLLPLLIYFAVHDISEILLWAGIEAVMGHGGENIKKLLTENAYTVQGMVNGMAILLGVFSIWTAVSNEIKGDSSKKEAVGEQKNRKLSNKEPQVTAYMFLGALALLTAAGINILFYQLGFTESSQSYERVSQMQYGVSFVIGLLLYGVISPLAEEAVFRGLIYNRMKRCFSYRIALILSSVLFGFYHGNMVQAAYGILLGLLIAYVYEIYKSFAAPVLFHAVANVSVYAMTYQNDLKAMNRQIALTTVTIMLAAAAGILFYIKKIMRKEKTKAELSD